MLFNIDAIIRLLQSGYNLINTIANSTFTGTSGNDTLIGNNRNNLMIGGAGNDVLDGGAGNDILSGGAGDDILLGGTGNDTLLGGTGNDTLDGGAGADQMTGNGGNDIYFIDGSDTVVEYRNEGDDAIIMNTSMSNYTLGANIEVLINRNGGAFHGIGNALNNQLVGGTGDDVLEGLDGDDTLMGLGGNDRLVGGNGNDLLNGGDNQDTLIGGAGNDVYVISDEFDTVIELENGGNDTVRTNLQNYQLQAQVENLSHIGNAISFEGHGNALNNTIESNAATSRLFGYAGNDTLVSGVGNDVLSGGEGDDQIQGGLGNDTLDYSDHSASVDVDLRRGTSLSTFGSDTFSSMENIIGGSNTDNLTGDAGVNVINGGAGDDHINGDAGDDYLTGDDGNDQLTGGDGNDHLDGGYGNDDLQGGSGKDIFTDWNGINTFNGGDGDDTISYANFSGDFLVSPIITIELNSNFSYLESYGFFYIPGITPDNRTINSTNTFSSIENAVGSNFNDFIYGSSEKNKIDGLGGDDLIWGGLGDDIINGGDGTDTLSFIYTNFDQHATVSLIENSSSVISNINGRTTTLETDQIFDFENVIGGFGNDTISGNDLNNTLDGAFGSDALYGLGGDDTLIGGRGGDSLDGGDGSDTADYRLATEGLFGSLEFQGINSGNDADILISIENIIASEFDDQLFGNNKGNRIEGRNGDDFLYGQDGNDTLIGDNGNDQLYGDAGDDRLIGGKGNDQLYGGVGNDWLSDVEGSNSFDGGLGSDYADFSEAKSGIDASLSTGIATNVSNNNAALIFSSNLISIENLQGSRYGDVLEGNNQNNVIDGGLGTDTVSYINLFTSHSVDANLFTGQGSVKDGNSLVYDIDTLISIENLTGSSGNDTLTGNDQDNVLIGGAGADRLSGGGGNDVIYAEVGKDKIIDGGAGIDTLHVNFTSGNIATDGKKLDFNDSSVFENFENLVGSAFSELIVGDSQNNRIDGGLGNDQILGGAGDDVLIGGDGINFINGGSGHNIIDGRNSNNLNNISVATYNFLDGVLISNGLVINLKLEKGNATLASSDLSTLTLIDDYINIFAVETGKGNDMIIGNDQNNIFWGGFGNDSIFASGGNDVIDGGSGFDLLEGGDGADIFVFAPSISPITEVDTILDFGFGGNDKIDLRSFGVINSSNLEITNSVGRTFIEVRNQNSTQQIILENPIGGPVTLDDFILTGFSNPQTNLYDSYTNLFG